MFSFLKKLTSEEFNKLEKFINSPFFNTRPIIILLFNYLKKKLNNLNDFSKVEIFRSIYPGEKYNDPKIRRLLADFKALYEKFLGYYRIEKCDRDFVAVRSLEMMYEKGMHEFQSTYKQTSRYLKSKFIKDDNYYKNLARVESLNFYNSYNKYKLRSEESLKNSSLYIDLHFVFSKMHLYRDILLYKISSGKDFQFETELFNEAINYTTKNIAIIKKNHPNLYIIYLVVMATIEKKKKNYIKKLMMYIRKNEKRFDKERLNYYYTYVTSYYWTEINGGNIKYFKSVFDIYKYMESNNFLKINDCFAHHIFNSIVIAALSNFEFDWTERFINKYKGSIEPGYERDAYNINLAKLYFIKKDYNSALNYLNNVEYKDPNYFISAKILLAKTLYEQGDLGTIKYVIDSLKHYAFRNKNLVSHQVKGTKMIVKYLSLLIQGTKKGHLNTLRLKKMLDDEKQFVPHKNWFYEKTSELSNLEIIHPEE